MPKIYLTIMSVLCFYGCKGQNRVNEHWDLYHLKIFPAFEKPITIDVYKDPHEYNYRIKVDTGSDSSETLELPGFPAIKLTPNAARGLKVDTTKIKKIDEIIHQANFKRLVSEDSIVGYDGAIWEIGYGKKRYTEYFEWWAPDFQTNQRNLTRVLLFTKEMLELDKDLFKDKRFYKTLIDSIKSYETR